MMLLLYSENGWILVTKKRELKNSKTNVKLTKTTEKSAFGEIGKSAFGIETKYRRQ